MSDCVYLIRASNGLIKIGWTSDVEQRLRYLKTGSPLKLELIHVIETDQARTLEGLLHERFKRRRRIGEWFRLTPSEVSAIYAKYVPELPDLPAGPPRQHSGANLKIAQVAAMTGRRKTAIQELVKSGLLFGFRTPGGHWRVPVSEVERLLRGDNAALR